MDKTKKIISVFLVTFFISYYFSTFYFVHTHQQDGRTITHSHPYTSGNHSHSDNSFHLISSLSNLLFFGGLIIFNLTFMPVPKAIFSSYKKYHATSIHLGSNPLRAPPC